MIGSQKRTLRTGGLGLFVAQRLALCLVSALFVGIVVFFAIRSIPGDPARVLLGDNGTEADYLQLRSSMGLDDPLPVQFLSWVGQIASGDLGFSFAQSQDVAALVLPAAANSLALGGFAAILAIIFGLVLGNVATGSSRAGRRSADWVESAFLSAPQYTVALVLLIVFAVQLRWFPAGGTQSVGGGGLGDVLFHLLLPAIALALTPAAHMARSLKTSIAGFQDSELAAAFETRGLSRLQVSAHIHHNALPPMLTVLGMQIGSILGGTIFIETLFSIPGLGALLVYSVGIRDYATVQVISVGVALIAVVMMFLTDLTNALIDPRIRVAVR